MQHPKTFWYKILEKYFPSRCREVPEATEPNKILIRQFAIWKGRIYLQQFASGENPAWLHSHPWKKGTIAIGLWGSVVDCQVPGADQVRLYKAPYIRLMGPNHYHQTLDPSKGHTSIFIGLGEKTDFKYYLPKMEVFNLRKHWTTHIQKLVKRI